MTYGTKFYFQIHEFFILSKISSPTFQYVFAPFKSNLSIISQKVVISKINFIMCFYYELLPGNIIFLSFKYMGIFFRRGK